MGEVPVLEYSIDSGRVKDHLVNALNYIHHYDEFWQLTDHFYPGLLPNQMGRVRSAYSKLKGASSDNFESNIPQIEIPILNDSLKQCNRTILIGGVINSSGGIIQHSSFSLCITFSSNVPDDPVNGDEEDKSSCCLINYATTKRIVRRFHFDHQPYEKKRPPAHLQYGGNFPGTGVSGIEWHYCIDDLDNPRIHYFPMDFVLVLDLAINDFKTPLSGLAREPEWKELVQQSQQIWWRGYLNWLKANICDRDDCNFHDILYN